ncbi:MAG: DnaB-like helicase C-terminal domain-containing protein, partial [Clostridia bacterium]
MTDHAVTDIAAERIVLSNIIYGGKDGIVDVEDIVDATDFSLAINSVLFTTLKHLSETDGFERFTFDNILMQARALGFAKVVDQKENKQYIELLTKAADNADNPTLFAAKVKKCAIIRELCQQHDKAIRHLTKMTGTEAIEEILNTSASYVEDYVNGVHTDSQTVDIGYNIAEQLETILISEPVTHVGLPTGFPIWDEAVGNGIRKGTVHVIGARPKVGKSFYAANVGYNVAAKYKVPVLYLDTELTEAYQQTRLICMASGCPLTLYETGMCKDSPDLVKRLREAAGLLQSIPFGYHSVAGMEIAQMMCIIKRWLSKKVGFNSNGKANDCLIILDYLKLMNKNDLSSSTPEFIVLGLILTALHNFAVQYDLPILTFVQLNRDGIDGEDTSVVAGSDRILWLASSL